MAHFQDFKPKHKTGEALYRQITRLLVGMHSVEVIPDGDSVIFRRWFQGHCSTDEHQKIPSE